MIGPGPSPGMLVFAASLGVMCIELSVGRVLSGLTGGGLFTWTATVGAALAAISLGSAWGGRLTETKRNSPSAARLLFFASLFSAWPVGGQFLAGPRGPCSSLPVPIQPLLSAPLLLFPGVFFLASLCPVAAAEALSRSHRPGRQVGALYALGALGSIAGTFLAGFLWIPWIGSKETLLSCACLLALLSGWTGKGRWWARAAVWSFCCVALAGFSRARDGDPELLYQKESAYHAVQVRQQARERLLVLDGMVHSRVLLEDEEALGYDYERVFAELTTKLDLSTSPSFLCLGGGGYVLPRHLVSRYPNSRVDVVEIDEQVTRAAQRFLGLPNPPPFAVHHQDARRFVRNLEEDMRYDAVYADIFRGLAVPWHLCTKEFHAEVAAHLKPDGAYLMNLIDQPREGAFLASTVQTLKDVFPNVRVYWVPDTGSAGERATFVAMSTFLPYKDLSSSLYERFSSESSIDRAIVLTDSYAPVDPLLLPVVWNLKMGQDLE